ncbi:MAG TPA: SPOR domain-containing protein [Woeseiaceae bacterium]|nr:SPOR domain-containing protein [Woeseiaceae bacterium]
MAKRRKRRSTSHNKQSEYPGWVWMVFGLAIGLSVAFAVYVNDREPATQVATVPKEPASLQDSIDHNSEEAAPDAPAPKPVEDRFDFYKMLPAFEMIIESDKPAVDRDVEPKAIDEPGVYMLQAGSFSTHNDADRRKAELALHGIESRVQRARVNNRDYYRVYIGPIDDLGKLNVTRSRLRAAQIDVMRIRLGD